MTRFLGACADYRRAVTIDSPAVWTFVARHGKVIYPLQYIVAARSDVELGGYART